MIGMTVETFNSFQQDIREVHNKYGMGFLGTMHLKLKTGEYPIAEPIHLISETILEGTGESDGKRNEKT